MSEKTLCSVQVITQQGTSILDSWGILQEGTVQTTDNIHNSHHCFHIKLTQAHDYLGSKYVQINWFPIISYTSQHAMLCF